MKNGSSHTSRNRYTRHAAAGSSRPSTKTIILLIIMLTALALLMLASEASAVLGDFLLVAGLLTSATAEDGSSFDLTGSAYIEPGNGLRVNETGHNLLTNPSFETGVSDWSPLGAAVVTPSPGSAAFGSSSMAIDAAPNGGVSASAPGAGAVKTTFSIFLKSDSGAGNSVYLALDGSASGRVLAGPFNLTGEWQRFRVTRTMTSGDAQVFAHVLTAGGSAPSIILADGAQLERKGWLTPYFDGDQTGCAWTDAAHGSTSTRAGGIATIPGSELDFVNTEPFWFALEVELGFDRVDVFGSYPVGTKDFINIVMPNGSGTGTIGNEGIILDYYSISKNLSFYRINSRGVVSYPTSAFKAGDLMRVVCSWDPATGMRMWVKLGDSPLFQGSDASAAARSVPPAQQPEWVMSVSDSGCWWSYGDYQSNSLHRNLMVKQGTVDSAMALDYIADPAGFTANCGRRPDLTLAGGVGYWATMAAYEQRLLSVDYTVSNIGAGSAVDLGVIGAIASNGVSMVSATLMDAGDIASGGASNFTVSYMVPPGVSRFKATLYATAQDSCGTPHHFPSTYPGS